MTRPPLVTICPSLRRYRAWNRMLSVVAAKSKPLMDSLSGYVSGIPAGPANMRRQPCAGQFHCLGIEVYPVHAFEKLYNVALDAVMTLSGFRVAHTHIVFDNHRPVLYIDKSQENEAFCTGYAFAQPVDGRLYDAFAHLSINTSSPNERGCCIPIPPVFNPLSPSDTFIVLATGSTWCSPSFRINNTEHSIPLRNFR